MKQYITATILLLVTLTCTAAGAADTPCILCDFETEENTNGPVGGSTGFFRHQSGSGSVNVLDARLLMEYIADRGSIR